MLFRLLVVLLGVLPVLPPAQAAEEEAASGTYRGRVLTERFLHRQALARGSAALTEELSEPLQDQGHIAIIDTSRGVLPPINPIDISNLTLRFEPIGSSGYRGSAGPATPSFEAREQGLPLGLDDDDFDEVELPFDFPFFGNNYSTVFVGSDGHVTFDEGDDRSFRRSVARAMSGPPRIAPLFVDLDPSRFSARVRSYLQPDRAIFTWDGVPLFSAFSNGRRQTFQLEMHADGRLAFHYIELDLTRAVVGVFPGRLAGEPASVDLSRGFGASGPGGFAEIFQTERDLDDFAVGQSFYRNHDDAYDFLIVFNDLGLSAGAGAFAYELNVRNEILGIGDLLGASPVFDFGPDFGSAKRLTSFVNMGPVTNYPRNPEARIPFIGENNTLSLLGQEAGHRWGVYVRFIDPATGLRSGNLLGRQNAHWSFFFNSNASVMEGNHIVDNGPGADPRFVTVETVARYGELDQYIMGLRGPEETPPSFLVESPTGIAFPNRSRAPQTGVEFGGSRKEIPVDLIVAAEGPRVPDDTVANREFRFAFILLVERGAVPSADAVAKVDGFRQAWGPYFEAAVNGRATASTELVRMLELSAWPAAGVGLGMSGQATVSLARPRPVDFEVALSAERGRIRVPGKVTIPAGETSATFPVDGVDPGVDVLHAAAVDPGYERSTARIQVSPLPSLTLEVESGDAQDGATGARLPEPVVFRLLDRNRLPYAGVEIELAARAGSSVEPTRATTDLNGRIRANWTLGPIPGPDELSARVSGAETVSAIVKASSVGVRPSFSRGAVVSAAGLRSDPRADDDAIAPGGLISIFGSGLSVETKAADALPLPRTLANVQVRINGAPTPLLFVSPGQINLQAPFELSGSTANIVVSNLGGVSETVAVPAAAVQPGIFFDGGTGLGAIVFAADGLSPWNRPADAGEWIAIYASGLGPVSPRTETGEAAPVFNLSRNVLPVAILLDGRRLEAPFAGLAPGFAGLWQVNVQLPQDLTAGEHQLALEVDGRRSNAVRIEVR
jgi:uncharacterized protein (TIGR03437 family)